MIEADKFFKVFHNEKIAEEVLSSILYNGEEPTCPYCHTQYYRKPRTFLDEHKSISKSKFKTKRYACDVCKKRFTIKTGTPFHKKKNLHQWFFLLQDFGVTGKLHIPYDAVKASGSSFVTIKSRVLHLKKIAGDFRSRGVLLAISREINERLADRG